MKTIHLFRNGQVERGTANARNPQPGYRWHVAFSQAMPPNRASQPLTLNEWRAMAKRDGQKVKVHDWPETAHLAAIKEAK